jgi:hypothetical protein
VKKDWLVNYNNIMVNSMRLEEGIDWYRDPETGLEVWTRKFLLDRGYCCNGGCRHCPYDDAGRPIVLSGEKVKIVGIER